jgi:signal transduction histidine kinase
MKTLRIQYWLVLALAVYIVIALLPFPLVANVLCSSDKPSPEALSLAQTVNANFALWGDPAWQKSLLAKIPGDSSLVLLNGSGKELFRAGKPPFDPTPAGYNQVLVMDGARLLGTADLYNVSACGGRIYGTLAIPVSLALQIGSTLVIAWVLARYVMKPLAAMSAAARMVASGNLDFQVPRSRVREVAEVSAAFAVMGDALRGSLTRQAELEQDRRFFISAIAHDLRAPLFALRGYLSGLEKGLAITPEKTAHYIAVCQEKADTLERLITDLFAFARLEYLEQSPQPARIDFAHLVNQAVEDSRLQAGARQIDLAIESSPSPCEVTADGAFLARALGNLLENALRYTPQGGAIRVSWVKEHGLVRFSVSDTGPGIDPADLPHVFDPLYRAETSRNRDTGGAGLGLTIARRILLAHGGSLTAANRPEGGAVFSGTFPEIYQS